MKIPVLTLGIITIALVFGMTGAAYAQSCDSGPIFTSGGLLVSDDTGSISPFNESSPIPGTSGYIWAMTPNFTASPTAGDVPLTVAFYDMIPDPSGAFRWDFGDGSTSSSRSPVHVYSMPGVYTVSLSVTTGNNGQNSQWSFQTTVTKNDFIKVTGTGESTGASLASGGASQQAWLSEWIIPDTEPRIPVVGWGSGSESEAKFRNSLYTQAASGNTINLNHQPDQVSLSDAVARFL